jgi:serine/threonine protein kinase/Tol biopolymer transport system component
MMTLEAGRSLANYRLVGKLGEGGMGEVWKALDMTLGRDVALKFLPAALAADPERLLRFEREAKVLASLNHPGIAGIYGFHEHQGVRFLAMELVPGEDLAQRLTRGAVPVSETIDIARQIAEALEAAHDQGIVHRDLKPANVKLTPDGKVKVLDFGLAKALDPTASGGQSGIDSRMSPTITSLGTVAGVILGTAAYMSPEQAKGRAVDRRTDIWAFGCLLYEMLAGRRPFDGEGISEVLAAVIMAPIAFDALPASIPARLQQLVRRCLERDPRRRLRDVGEARLALEDIQSGKTDERPVEIPPSEPARRSPIWIALAATAVVTALLAYGVHRAVAPSPAPAPVRRFEIPAVGPFRSANQSRLAGISPDGKAVAYVDAGKLFVRPLSRIEPILIPTPSEPLILFWSPDSAFIGYALGAKLWKAPAGGGESSVIADIRVQMTGGSSASWCPDGKIVFTSGDGGVQRVSASGGDFEELVTLEKGKESDIHDATCLPDNSVLFVPHAEGARPSSLSIFADRKRKELLKLAADQDLWFPAYSPAGFILYHRRPANTGVWALPFSLAKREVTGEPFMVAANADVPSVSIDGTLVFVKGATSRSTRMIWTDRSGTMLAPIGPLQDQWPFPEISPDGRSVAISAKENELGDIWIHDAERGTRTRLSASQSQVAYSVEAWSPDGRSLVYSEGSTPPLTMKSREADGSGEAKTLGTGWDPAYSSDGRYLVFADFDKDTSWDLWYLDTRAGPPAVALVKGKSIEIGPRLSPDASYFAYVSDESGNYEVYLKRFPAGEGRWQVSTSGGMWPRFSRRGDKLYYANGDAIMEVDVTLGADPKLGVPRKLFDRRPLGLSLVFGWFPGFDVSADGSRFVVIEPESTKRDLNGIVVEENWSREFVK